MPESNLYLGIIIRSQNTDYPLKYVPVFAYEERHFRLLYHAGLKMADLMFFVAII